MHLFFMHIPKTAGSSFRRFLERSVRRTGGRVAGRLRDGIWSESSESYPSYEEFLACRGDGYRDSELVCGHYPYHVRQLLPPDTKVLTVFRDPLARCISHVKHQIAFESATGARQPEPTVNDFLSNPRNEMFIATVSNLAVKYLAFEGEPDAVVPADSLSLNLAVERSLEIDFGFAEELGEFQTRLRNKYFESGSSSHPEAVERENQSVDPFRVEDLSSENRRLLEAANEADLELMRLVRMVAGARWGPLDDRSRPTPQLDGAEDPPRGILAGCQERGGAVG